MNLFKVWIYSDQGEPEWHGRVIEVSRVPCIGEFVRIDNYTVRTVRQVIHQLHDDDSVAGVTLAYGG